MKTRTLPLLALALQLFQVVGGQEIWPVSLSKGDIEGYKKDVNGGRSYYSFKGIPYAKTPIGPLRFKDPQPADAWVGVLNGSIDAPFCAQQDRRQVIAIGSEDCLYLNVFSPGPNSSNLPVMFWIHGGFFYNGDALIYVPDQLLQKDVVVVVVQYRLNLFGFISTEDSVMPGNLGLKDQILALQWVRDNIVNFGGDPNSVTAFGQSAGAISINYLMYSPPAKGLFHRAIAQSAVALVPLILRDDHRKNAAIFGQMLNCSGISVDAYNSQDLYDCLQTFDSEELILANAGFNQFDGGPRVMMPRVDGVIIPEHISIMVREGKYQNDVDFMIGITREEGAFYIRRLLLTNASPLLAGNFDINGPVYLGVDYEDLGVYIAKRLFFAYMGDIVLTEDNAYEMVKMFTDYVFGVPMDLTAQFRLRDSCSGKKTYLYELHHQGEFSMLDSPALTVGKDWVGHVDDLQYLFTAELTGIINSPADLFMSEIIVALWTNFARTGNPTPDLSLGFKWPAISGKDLCYLILELSPYVRGFTRQKEVEFMKNLPTTINKLLFPDCFSSEGCKQKRGKGCRPRPFLDALYEISVDVQAKV